MTTAEQLMARGEARGEARGRASTLAQFLTYKFGPLPQSALDRLHTATIDQLEAWTNQVITAETLEQALD